MKAPPRYFWHQNYEVGDSMHWALNDTHSTQEGKVSCCYMVLLADYPTCMDGKPLSEQDMPKRIVELLNSQSEIRNLRNSHEALVKALGAIIKDHEKCVATEQPGFLTDTQAEQARAALKQAEGQ